MMASPGTVSGGLACRPDILEVATPPLHTISSASSIATPANYIATTAWYQGLPISSLGALFLFVAQPINLDPDHRQGELTFVSYPYSAAHQQLDPARSGHRARESEWRRIHQDKLQLLAGQWIVLEGERIVATGPDPAQVVATARAQGIAVPYVFYVEPSAEEHTAKIGL